MNHSSTNRPIFIIGLPRSGTTLFYRSLARHPKLSWFSPATRKYPQYRLPSRIRSIYRNKHLPVEASRVWSRFAKNDNDVLTAADVTPKAKRYYRSVVLNQMQLADKPRFLAKHPRNGLRIPFFKTIFPDAYFIHLIRDGYAVAESIMRRRKRCGGLQYWYDIRPPGWKDQLQKHPVYQIGWQWTQSIRTIRSFASELPPHQYTEVKYEDFCREPAHVLQNIARFCEIDDNTSAKSSLQEIVNQNEKWRRNLNAEQIKTLQDTIEPMRKELGYT